MRSYIRSSVGADVSRALSAPTLQAAAGARASSARSSRVALLHRPEELDDRLADVALQVAVARGRRSEDSTSGIGVPVATERISIRFETPGFSSGA